MRLANGSGNSLAARIAAQFDPLHLTAVQKTDQKHLKGSEKWERVVETHMREKYGSHIGVWFRGATLQGLKEIAAKRQKENVVCAWKSCLFSDLFLTVERKILKDIRTLCETFECPRMWQRRNLFGQRAPPVNPRQKPCNSSPWWMSSPWWNPAQIRPDGWKHICQVCQNNNGIHWVFKAFLPMYIFYLWFVVPREWIAKKWSGLGASFCGRCCWHCVLQALSRTFADLFFMLASWLLSASLSTSSRNCSCVLRLSGFASSFFSVRYEGGTYPWNRKAQILLRKHKQAHVIVPRIWHSDVFVSTQSVKKVFQTQNAWKIMKFSRNWFPAVQPSVIIAPVWRVPPPTGTTTGQRSRHLALRRPVPPAGPGDLYRPPGVCSQQQPSTTGSPDNQTIVILSNPSSLTDTNWSVHKVFCFSLQHVFKPHICVADVAHTLLSITPFQVWLPLPLLPPQILRLSASFQATIPLAHNKPATEKQKGMKRSLVFCCKKAFLPCWSEETYKMSKQDIHANLLFVALLPDEPFFRLLRVQNLHHITFLELYSSHCFRVICEHAVRLHRKEHHNSTPRMIIAKEWLIDAQVLIRYWFPPWIVLPYPWRWPWPSQPRLCLGSSPTGQNLHLLCQLQWQLKNMQWKESQSQYSDKKRQFYFWKNLMVEKQKDSLQKRKRTFLGRFPRESIHAKTLGIQC